MRQSKLFIAVGTVVAALMVAPAIRAGRIDPVPPSEEAIRVFVQTWITGWETGLEKDEARQTGEIQGLLRGYRPKHLREFVGTLRKVAESFSDNYKARFVFGVLSGRVDEWVRTVPITDYAPAVWNEGEDCYMGTRPIPTHCHNRLGGFALAAYQRAQGGRCYSGIENLSGAVVAGYMEWWKIHAVSGDERENACLEPVVPVRCIVGYCAQDHSYGVALRASAGLGATIGSGLGFKKGEFVAQMGATIGARFFFLDDSIDVHGGLGIGTSAVSDEPGDVAPYFVLQAGLGLYKGLFGVSAVFTTDPFELFPADSNSGFGLSIYVDASSIERLVGN